MERARKAIPTDAIRLRKLGGGSMRITDSVTGRKKIIKSGQIFVGRLSDIPANFIDLIEVVDEKELARVSEAAIPKPTFELRHAGDNKYDVVRKGTDKPLTEKPVTQDEAELFIANLK